MCMCECVGVCVKLVSVKMLHSLQSFTRELNVHVCTYLCVLFPICACVCVSMYVYVCASCVCRCAML